MGIEDVFSRLSSGKWEGRRVIDVAAEDPKWCKRSASSVLVPDEYRDLLLKALAIVENTGYSPEIPIDDPRSVSTIPKICGECGEMSDSYITKAPFINVLCLTCYSE